ncbi:RES domain-containing protein [bacterium]|nr:MAG: RES domain-containing protein [bacterium]
MCCGRRAPHRSTSSSAVGRHWSQVQTRFGQGSTRSARMRSLRHVKRGGSYLRALGPKKKWSGSPDDTAYSKISGGRWNPPGEFGVLYLSGSADVAYANGREILNGLLAPAATVDDLLDPESLFEVQEFLVDESEFVDAVTKNGRAELALPARCGKGKRYALTRAIGRAAYKGGENGIASISAVQRDGEELAIFDSCASKIAHMRGARRTLRQWRAGRVGVKKKSSKKSSS